MITGVLGQMHDLPLFRFLQEKITVLLVAQMNIRAARLCAYDRIKDI